MSPWPKPEWKEAKPFPFSEARRSFTGPRSEAGSISIRYYARPGGALAALVGFGPRSEGAPGQVHGGAILTALDEALGAAAWLAGHRVMTVRLATEFRRAIPVGLQGLVETKIVSVRHRIVAVSGALVDEAGALYASADGRFMVLDEPTQRRLFGRGAEAS